MICPSCTGNGICPRCRGMGQQWCPACGGRGEGADRVACASCEGSGLAVCPPRCPTCEGRGMVLATVEQAVAATQAGPASASDEVDFPPATALLLTLTFFSFALEGIVPAYRYHFWLYGRQAMDGQWWQIFTASFLHTNLIQLGFNMAALFVFGPPLENVIGSARFAALYVGCGAIGNLVSVVAYPLIQSVGASGCVFGVGGAWIGLQVRERLFSQRVVALLLVYIVLMLVFGFAADGALNNWAHLGGFVSGFLLMLAFGSGRVAPTPLEGEGLLTFGGPITELKDDPA